MSGKARRVFLTEKMHIILTTLSKQRMLKQSILVRSRMILLAYQKQTNSQIAETLGVQRQCVGRWRRRWQDSIDALLEIELNESHAVLRRTIIDVFLDAYRSGSPGSFSDQQIANVISIGSQSPRDFDRPVDSWTGRELADEAIKQNIVPSISGSRVNEFLRLVKLKPQHRKGWCFTTEKDRASFELQMQEVCETYLQASERQQVDMTRTVCVDEMTSLQANQRRAETKLPKPNQTGKMECQYNRHGTLSLTGSWDVVGGQMIKTTIDETRTGKDFAMHVGKTVATDPDANWIFVMDNLNTHCGEEIVRTVAELIGYDQDELGDKKRRRGILASMASRRAFLTDSKHPIRFVFIPKHSSWLNQIEIMFGVISKRVMRHGNFTSKADLREKLQSFVDYFNRTFARPVNWTFDGKSKKTQKPQRPKTWRENTQNKKTEKILALVV